jgi:hypothetical protein
MSQSPWTNHPNNGVWPKLGEAVTRVQWSPRQPPLSQGCSFVTLNGRRVGLEDDEWKQSP